MNSVISRFAFFAVITLSLTACFDSPLEKAFDEVLILGCNMGNVDAYKDFVDKKIDLNYVPKEELKLFKFGQYSVPDTRKDDFKQLFQLAARACYREAIKKTKFTNV